MSEYKVVFLTDGVVVLRPVLRSDLPFALVCVNDPEVRRTIGQYLPTTEKDEEKWLEKMSDNKLTDIVFMIEVGGERTGIMGIHKINWKDRTAVTGALIKSTEHRGKGYGTRAKMLVLREAFYELGLRKICSQALAFNVASLRFNEKCGYREEGRLRQHVLKNGVFHDLVLTAVFQEGFDPLWQAHIAKYNITV